jgi:hypothetical protein
MQVSSTSSAQRGSFKPTKSFIGIENLGRKSTNLAKSRCSVSTLVSALVALFGRNPVVWEMGKRNVLCNNSAESKVQPAMCQYIVVSPERLHHTAKLFTNSLGCKNIRPIDCQCIPVCTRGCCSDTAVDESKQQKDPE